MVLACWSSDIRRFIIMNTMLCFKILFIFMSVFFTTVNIARMYGKQNVPVANFLYQAIGITGFIVLEWLL